MAGSRQDSRNPAGPDSGQLEEAQALTKAIERRQIAPGWMSKSMTEKLLGMYQGYVDGGY